MDKFYEVIDLEGYTSHFVRVARRSDSGLKTEACQTLLTLTYVCIWNAEHCIIIEWNWCTMFHRGPPALLKGSFWGELVVRITQPNISINHFVRVARRSESGMKPADSPDLGLCTCFGDESLVPNVPERSQKEREFRNPCASLHVYSWH